MNKYYPLGLIYYCQNENFGILQLLLGKVLSQTVDIKMVRAIILMPLEMKQFQAVVALPAAACLFFRRQLNGAIVAA